MAKINKEVNKEKKESKKKQKNSFWLHFGFASLALGVSFLVWFITTIL